MRLLLIRHGESVGNAEGRTQGQKDFPLSPRGIEQAELLAARLRDRQIDHMYTSPLARADQTAAIVAGAKAMTVEPLPSLMEYDFGTLSGFTWTELQAKYPKLVEAQRNRGAYYAPWPGEEGREAFRERVCAAIWALEAKHAEETVAVVTHGGVIAVFCQSVLDLDHTRRPPFAVENTSVFEVEVRGGRGTLLTANDTCHLHVE